MAKKIAPKKSASTAKRRGPAPLLAADDAAGLAAFLDRGNDPAKKDHRTSKSLLHRAVDAAAVACVRLLLSRGATDDLAFTAVCMDGKLDMLRNFLAAGHRPRPVDLSDAATRGHVEAVRVLIERMRRADDGSTVPIPGTKLARALGGAKIHAGSSAPHREIVAMLEASMQP